MYSVAGMLWRHRRVDTCMTEFLVAVWFASAIGGMIAVFGGVVGPRRVRHRLFAFAAVFFAVAGVLGILSIGIVFLMFSAACFIFSGRVRYRLPSRPVLQ